MNNDRHYPQAFKLAIVALLAFDVVIFFNAVDWMVRIYCGTIFVAILNGWAAAEDDSIIYGDLYLLNDAICSAMYFMTLLELNKGVYDNFWLFSCIIFLMYALWNKMLEMQKQIKKRALHKYLVCDLVACVYSLFAYLIVRFSTVQSFENFVQYIGMMMWLSVLLVWYYDFYVQAFRSDKKTQSGKDKNGGKS
jgi:hypothetical protein